MTEKRNAQVINVHTALVIPVRDGTLLFTVGRAALCLLEGGGGAEREREGYVCESARTRVCVCVCKRERGRGGRGKREREREGERERERNWISAPSVTVVK